MVFNSSDFALFLPVLLLFYIAVFRHERLRDLLLLIASYIFYMAWYWQYAGLIALSTFIDYFVGRKMAKEENQKKRKMLLITSLTVNLGLLGIFKYYNFFVDLTKNSLTLMGVEISIPHHELLLPVGISFYTFQTLSYTIDLYRKKIEYEPKFVKFAVFVSFFPQLVAGPIVRASVFLPQMHRTPPVSQKSFDLGLRMVFFGLFKKIVIADMLAKLAVDAVFANPAAYSSWDLLMALYGYAFQIYCDFSAYSDIAIGVALMLGFRLPMNFNRPYLAQSAREFWTRWHISLSEWLRDYLYIPLGGNRGKKGRTIVNLMLTMLIGGLWHGAALNFILWGGYHGLLLVLTRNHDRKPGEVTFLIRMKNQIITFHLILVSWLLFRVNGWDNFVDYVQGLTQFSMATQLHPFFYSILALAILLHIIPKGLFDRIADKLFDSQPVPVRALVYSLALLGFLGLTLQAPAFIYFQF